MTWNIEGVKSNIFVLKDVLLTKNPDFVFLSEPQVYQADIQQHMQYLSGCYSFHLNSEDLFDPELPFVKSRAHGGTLVLWRSELDPFVTVYNTATCSFQPIILKLPDCQVSVHFSIYLPTSGKDSDFISELANLRNCLEDV